jgi:hypothetical protein
MRGLPQRSQSLDEMKQPRSLLGQAIQNLNGQAVQELVPENRKLTLGDYWRVLRVRPATSKYKAEQLQLEYIPNSIYGYYEVKTTLENVKRVENQTNQILERASSQGCPK